MKYRLERKKEMVLTVFEVFSTNCRENTAKESLNRMISYREILKEDCNYLDIYQVLTEFSSDGFCLYSTLLQSTKDSAENMEKQRADPCIQGRIYIPEGLYFICESEWIDFPNFNELRRRAIIECFPHSNFELRNAPEIDIIRINMIPEHENPLKQGSCEIWFPIVKK